MPPRPTVPTRPMDHCIVYTNIVKTVPKDQHTAAYKLFHYRYSCSVQQMFTVDVKTAADWGLATTGDSKLDREQRGAWVNIFPTPYEMLDYLDRGAQITYTKAEQAAEVYLIILTHLNDWLTAVRDDPTRFRAPLEGLRRFDDLAALVFRFAWPLLRKDQDATGYGEWLGSVKSYRGSLRRNESSVAQEIMSRGIQPRYRSYSAEIAEILDTRGRMSL